MTAYIARNEDERERMADWVSQRVAGAESGFGKPYQTIGFWRRGRLAAVAIYSGFRGGGDDLQCEISFASDDPLWCTKENIRLILWYGLVNLRCRRMTAITEANNSKVHRLLEHIGFRKEGRHPDMFKDGPAITYGITRRWFMREKRYGQVQSLAA